MNSSYLPYFKNKQDISHIMLAKALEKKYLRLIKDQNTLGSKLISRGDKRLEYISKTSKKYKYFFKLDISKFYPSTNHNILLNNLNYYLNIDNMSRTNKWRYRDKIIIIEKLLKNSPYKNQGLPLANYLSSTLAKYYLLPLTLSIKNPYLQYEDDFLIFFKSKKDIDKFTKEKLKNIFNYLKIEMNYKKSIAGRVHHDKFTYLGFSYYHANFKIDKEKIQFFKDKIGKITDLRKTKNNKAIIKLINNKLLGFGHYYKFSACSQDFTKLDAFIRQRLRRYIIKNENTKKNKNLNNLIITNNYLYSQNLKSLKEIKDSYNQKTRKNKKTKTKNETNTKSIISKIPYFSTNNKLNKLILLNQQIFQKLETLEKRIDEFRKVLKQVY